MCSAYRPSGLTTGEIVRKKLSVSVEHMAQNSYREEEKRRRRKKRGRRGGERKIGGEEEEETHENSV